MGRVDQRDGHEPETGEVKSQAEWREEERAAAARLGTCRLGTQEAVDAWAALERAIRGQDEARRRAVREVRWAEPLTAQEEERRRAMFGGPVEPMTVTEEVLAEARCIEESRAWVGPIERQVLDEPPPCTTEEYLRTHLSFGPEQTRKLAVVDAATLTTEQRALIVLACAETADVQWGFAREVLLRQVVSALDRQQLDAASLSITVGVEEAARRVLKDVA